MDTRTAIFDFDGTLCPNHVYKILFWKRLCRDVLEVELNPIRSQLKWMNGHIKILSPSISPDDAMIMEKKISEIIPVDVAERLFGQGLPKIRDFMVKLREQRVAILIASNSNTPLIKVLLDKVGIPYTAIFAGKHLLYNGEYKNVLLSKSEFLAKPDLAAIAGVPASIVFYVDDDPEYLAVKTHCVEITQGKLLRKLHRLEILLTLK